MASPSGGGRRRGGGRLPQQCPMELFHSLLFLVVAAVAVLCFVALTKLTLTCALLLPLLLPLQVATCGMTFGTSLCLFFYFCLRVALVLCVGKPNEIFTHFPFYILTCSCRSMLTQSCRVEALRPHMNLTFCVCFFAAKHI